MNLYKIFGIYKQNGDAFEFDETGEAIGDDWDTPDPHWDAVASAGADHTWATDQGWAGKEPNEDDFHPETGAYSGTNNAANHVQDWAKGLEEKHGVSLVNDLGEPNADIYSHHGLNEEPIDHSHITNYLQAKTGKTETFPGTALDKMLRKTFGIRKEIPYGSNAIQAHNEHPDNILQYHATKIFDQQTPPSSPEYHAKLRNAAEARVSKKLGGLAGQQLPPDHIQSEIDNWDIHDQEILERKLFSIEQEHGPGTVENDFGPQFSKIRLADSKEALNTEWNNYHSLNPGEDIHTRNRQQGLPSTRDIYGRDSMKSMYPNQFTDEPKDESL